MYSVIIYLTACVAQSKKINLKYYLLLGFLLGLSALTYTSGRIHIVFMIGLYLLLWWKNKISKRKFVTWLIGLIVVLVPLIIYFSNNPDIFINRYRIEMGKEQIGLSTRFIGIVARSYLSHFSPKYLLFKGDANLRHSTGFSGQIQIGLFIVFLIGLYRILRERKKLWLFLVGIILIAPIPATIVPNAPHALRSAIMGLPILIIGVYGFEKLIRKKNTILLVLIFVFVVGQNIFITYRYFTRYASYTPLAFETYGLKETLIKAQEMGGKNAYLTDISMTTYLFQRKINMIPPLWMNVEIFHREQNRLGKTGSCLVYTKSIYLNPQPYIDKGFTHYTEPDFAVGTVCNLGDSR
jgi:4-amino-4-deoxy-L-arabinose transferase-like glycosyltransferase